MKKSSPYHLRSDGVFIVECPVFKGCRSYGYSMDEALSNIQEAIELCADEEQHDEMGTIFIGLRDLEVAIS